MEVLKVNVEVWEDVYGGGVGRPDISPAMMQWYRDAFDEIEIPRCAPPAKAVNPGVEPDLKPEIDLFICSRETMDHVLMAKDAIGAHLFLNPDSDPFQDGTKYAKRIRVAVVHDRMEIARRLVDAIDADGEGWQNRLLGYQEDEASIAFHELFHGVLFMDNSGMLSPHRVSELHGQGLIEIPVENVVTGAGIRKMPNRNGRMSWSVTDRDAYEAMEYWCEMSGRSLYRQVEVLGKLPPFFMAAQIMPKPAPEPDAGMACTCG